MATYYARKSGNVNATDVWATTPTGTAGNYFSSFTNADTLMANSFTVTLNVNTTVLEVRNDTTGGATAGGSFTLSNGVTLTANVYSAGSSASTTVSYSGASPNSASIVGSINGNACVSVNLGGTGTLNITGNITPGSTASVHAITMTVAGTINIIGNITGSSGNAVNTVYIQTAGTVNITGNVTGGSSNSLNYGVNLAAGGTMNIVGVVTGGAAAVGASNGSTGTMNITRVKGNGFGNGSVGLSATPGVNSSQNALTRVYEIEYGDLGQSPTSGPIQIVDASSNVCLVYRTGGLSKKTLVDATATSGAFPANSSVRSGISFNNGNNTGTMAVPNANSVAYGVGVDNTTGNAVLTPANVWNYLTSNISTSGSIGERLKNCSTIASVGQQLSDSLNS